MALITLDHVSKVYPRSSRPALDDVTIHINRGEFVFLVGASGSGKTTLLSLLLHEEDATDGELRLAGDDLRRLSNRDVPRYRRSLGFIFQDYKLLENKTVWQNVAFALEVTGASRSNIRTLVPRVLKTVGLTGKENRYPHELSGGEAQRVAIARAYVNHPQILLADEPTGNLDPTTSVGIMEVLDAINRTGTTIVMATHNEEIVNSMRKRVIELHEGKLVRDEQFGSYDSSTYFPDEDVEQQAQEALQSVQVSSGVSNLRATDQSDGYARFAQQSHNNDARDAAARRSPSSQDAVYGQSAYEHTVGDYHDDNRSDGIARLAQSVHSGRTGRYGEAFAPIENTLTWGKGLPLDAYQQQGGSEGQLSVEHMAMQEISEQQSHTSQAVDEINRVMSVDAGADETESATILPENANTMTQVEQGVANSSELESNSDIVQSDTGVPQEGAVAQDNGEGTAAVENAQSVTVAHEEVDEHNPADSESAPMPPAPPMPPAAAPTSTHYEQ